MRLLACGSNEVHAKGTDGRGNSSYERGKESLHARTKMAGVCSFGVSGPGGNRRHGGVVLQAPSSCRDPTDRESLRSQARNGRESFRGSPVSSLRGCNLRAWSLPLCAVPDGPFPLERTAVPAFFAIQESQADQSICRRKKGRLSDGLCSPQNRLDCMNDLKGVFDRGHSHRSVGRGPARVQRGVTVITKMAAAEQQVMVVTFPRNRDD